MLLTSGIIKVYRSQLEVVWSYYVLSLQPNWLRLLIYTYMRYTNGTTRRSYGSNRLLYRQRGRCLSGLSLAQNVTKRGIMVTQLLVTMWLLISVRSIPSRESFVFTTVLPVDQSSRFDLCPWSMCTEISPNSVNILRIYDTIDLFLFLNWARLVGFNWAWDRTGNIRDLIRNHNMFWQDDCDPTSMLFIIIYCIFYYSKVNLFLDEWVGIGFVDAWRNYLSFFWFLKFCVRKLPHQTFSSDGQLSPQEVGLLPPRPCENLISQNQTLCWRRDSNFPEKAVRLNQIIWI